MIFLSASGQVVVDAVYVVVLWLVVAVAVLWHVVAVFLLVESVLMSLLFSLILLSWWRSMCFSRVRVFCGKSRHHFSHFLLRRRCHPNLFSRTLDRCCSVGNPQVAAFNTNDSCGSHPMALRLMDSLTCSPVENVILQERGHFSFGWTFQMSSF